ncbi:hypothetical protein WA026_002246 [Henosepilachna vigintioctopunctata]
MVVVFFLIYGVEVYFKVRGGFVSKPLQLVTGNEHEPLHALISDATLRPPVNASQLHQSRIGLLSQAFMLIIIVVFLFSETLSEFWKTKVPVNSRNWHDVVFRTVEIGVAVWFPAVLWNSMHPGELWILNPQKLLVKLEIQSKDERQAQTKELTEIDDGDAFINKRECWICYDGDKPEPLIQPCACTGDVSSVHHDCLRRWLVESATNCQEPLRCKVCNYAYEVGSTSKLDWERGFTAQHWGCTAAIVTCLCLVVAGAWISIQLYDNSYVRMLSASSALLVVYICIRFLGQNTLSAYQRAKVASLSIHNHVNTISENVNDDGTDTQIQTAL